MKQHWSEVCHGFYQSEPWKLNTKFNFLEDIVPENIISGFRKCAGVVPFNPDALLKSIEGIVSQSTPTQKKAAGSSQMKAHVEADRENNLNSSNTNVELHTRSSFTLRNAVQRI